MGPDRSWALIRLEGLAARVERVFDNSAFEELEEARIPNRQTVDKESLVAFFGSMGWIAELPDERRIPLLHEVRSLLSASEYALPWETRVYWARLGAMPLRG